MLGAMTSLTGGGGMSASSSATNGDFGASSDYSVGNMTFGGSSGKDNQMVIIALVVLVAVVAFKK